ncbi:MAG: MgtC/SapB family protein [Muribaculaceae bacterium]|jgi:putative Mg2+ transporter-C (MgtC) family protein|nr:MgtC/SapB family protein [Muribaculaceae bacterium]MBQ2370911.1 MgtC/SapB family protein [Muribaculaceae bacterium]MBQ2399635.1 MgtC/SapB family protein [Muribaculaceae bacterium]MBR5787197.1 MgtC/SapB family protein [Muribaculaceae bacterium]MEE1366219.1 MgtC/SapB family protein [Muribaculaceae bacterium]
MEFLNDLLSELMVALNSTEVTLENSAFRLVLSMILGMMVGMERKRKGQVAGVRTFALISMGACMAMLLSIYVPQEYLGLKNGDPGRIAAQVVTGVGFLGGGAMIHMRGSVRGLTTAAGIWMVATIGMSVGVGMYAVAIIGTLLILLTLIALEVWEHRRRIGQESRVICVKINQVGISADRYKEVLSRNYVQLSTFYMECNYDQLTTEFNFVVMYRKDVDLQSLFEQLRQIAPTHSIALSTQ